MSVQELPQLPTNGPIYVIGYVRVSGKRQETDGHSLEAQQKEIRKYCEERGWILLGIVVEVFSGWYLTERKKLTKMRDQYIKGEQVHVVLVWKLDRLSRDQNHMMLLAYEMAQHGVRLESVTENFDDSPTGILIRQVYSWASSLERTEIIERTKMGQHNRSDQGLLFGGGRGNYGWDWADEGDLKNARQVVSPKTASIVRRIYIWYVKYSLSYREIAKRLNARGIPAPGGGLWLHRAVARILRNPRYKGEAYNRRVKWEYVNGKKISKPHPNPTSVGDGVVPAIVSVELWEAAQARRKVAQSESKRRNKHPKGELLRAGFAFCGYCGAVMTVTHHYPNKGEKAVPGIGYRCGTWHDGGPKRCLYSPTIGAVHFDAIVWKFVGDILEQWEQFKDALQQNFTEAKENIASYDELIGQQEKEQARLMEDLRGTEGRTRALILTEIDRLSASIADLQDKRLVLIPVSKEAEHLQREVDEFLRWCAELKGHYEDATYDKKRTALRQLGVKVKIYRPNDPDHERWMITIKPEILDKLTGPAPGIFSDQGSPIDHIKSGRSLMF